MMRANFIIHVVMWLTLGVSSALAGFIPGFELGEGSGSVVGSGVGKTSGARITDKTPLVILDTSLGKIKLEIFDKEAPLSAENFRAYVRQGFYDGLIFHRVIPGFMIQGGGMAPGMKGTTSTRKPVPNEAGNGLNNKRGTISMARASDINSATSQFFINVNDNPSLDHRGNQPQAFGYAVFGKVVEGLDVADKIVAVPTSAQGLHQNVPVKDILIIKAYEEKGN